MLKLKVQESKIDRTLFLFTIGMTFFGILMIFDASSVIAVQEFGDKFLFARLQSFWAVLGLFLMLLVSKINYHFWRKLAFPLFLISVFFLILVLIPGIGLRLLGGRRWLGIGEFTFQPSELAKVFFVIYLSSLFQKSKNFWQFLIPTGLVGALVIMQPDLGTTLILIFSAFVVYFISGAGILEIGLISLGVVGSTLIFIFFSPYRLLRLKVFLNPTLDPQGASYHLRQILLALGSGGLWGRGIGQSRQKFLFLPEATTDSIFAIIGEEMGFVGALGILLVFWFFLVRGLKISSAAPDRFGQILAVGLTSTIFIQAFLNLGSMVSLVPLTGVPLPFISYGGSSLLVTLISIGILLNISKSKVKVITPRK